MPIIEGKSKKVFFRIFKLDQISVFYGDKYMSKLSTVLVMIYH